MRLKVTVLLLLALPLAAQTGGVYEIERSVVVSGGNRSSVGEYSLESTTGQTSVGGFLIGPGYLVYSGFWTPDIAPTAAGVSVSGRVITASGNPIGYARVVLTGADGVSSTLTGSFGYYHLTGVPAGQTYVVTVQSKRYQFEPLVVSILDEVTDLNLVAVP